MSESTLMPTMLVAAISAALLAPSVRAQNAPCSAGTCTIDGTSYTLDPAQDNDNAWEIVNQGTLTARQGAATRRVTAVASVVDMTGATVKGSMAGELDIPALEAIEDARLTLRGSRVINDGSSGVVTAPLVKLREYSTAELMDGTSVSGSEIGVEVDLSSELRVAGSRVSGTRNGLLTAGGDITVEQGSRIEGGINISFNDENHAWPDEVANIRVDASEIVNEHGAAISVGASPDDRYTFVHKARIELYNQSAVYGGDGNLLTVQSSETPSVKRTLVDLDVQHNEVQGNVTVKDDGSIANVALSNQGRINGIFTHVDTVDIQDGGYWQLAGDSDARALILGARGQLALGPMSAPQGHNRLTVESFDGQGGLLVFNTVLADDAGASDQLHITGDSSGHTLIQVRNVGGQGAPTQNGIQLVRIDGQSDAVLQLSGRAVGGAYEYFLYKGSATGSNDKDWYLRSQALPPPAAPDPPAVTPPVTPPAPVVPPQPEVVPPPAPVPAPYVVRVEPGAELGNLRAAQLMFVTDYHRRHAGQNHGRSWARVNGQRVGFDAGDGQLRIRGNNQSLHAGIDLLGDAKDSNLGVMLALGNATSTSTSHVIDGWARGKVKGAALGAYASWRPISGSGAYAGPYVDGWVQRQTFSNRVESWMGMLPSRYDSNAWQGSLEAGYAFQISGDAQRGGTYLEPQLQIGYTRLKVDRHVDSAGTQVDGSAGGLFGRAGLRLSGASLNVGNGAVVQPHLQVDWLYNRDHDAVTLDNDAVTSNVPTTRVRLEGGAHVRFSQRFGAWAGLSYEQKAGYHAVNAQFGLNYSW